MLPVLPGSSRRNFHWLAHNLAVEPPLPPLRRPHCPDKVPRPWPLYRNRLRALLTPAEHRALARLDTPQKIQTFIEKLPPNFELKGDTCMSPRRT